MVILVDLCGGEPFVAHLIVRELSATAALASAERIYRVCSDDDKRATRKNPIFHRSRPGLEEIYARLRAESSRSVSLPNAPRLGSQAQKALCHAASCFGNNYNVTYSIV
jgi:hypothetical protein